MGSIETAPIREAVKLLATTTVTKGTVGAKTTLKNAIGYWHLLIFYGETTAAVQPDRRNTEQCL